MRRFLFLLTAAALLAFAAPLTGCATKLRPGLDAAATWADGPKFSIGVGEYEFGELPNPWTAGVSSTPDPEVSAALGRLEEKAEALEARAQEVDAKLADPSTPPEIRAELEAAKAGLAAAKTAGDESARLAREAKAEADRLRAQADGEETPLTIPQGGGALAIVLAIGTWAVRSLKKRALLRAAAEAEALAKKHADEAIAKYDAAPENVAFKPDGTIVAA